jgi:hypothetical protein
MVTPLQSASSAGTASASTKAVAFSTANLTSGTKLVAVVAASGNMTSTTVTCKDGAGNTFTQLAVKAMNNAATNGQVYVFAIDTPAGDVGTKPTITATFSNAPAASILIQEVPGLATGTTLAAMVDGTPGTGSGNAIGATGSPSYASTVSGEYLVAVYGDNGGPTTWAKPAALTSDPAGVNSNSIADIALAYGSSTGTTEAESWSLTGTGTPWATFLLAFKLAAGGTPSRHPNWMRQRTALSADDEDTEFYGAFI